MIRVDGTIGNPAEFVKAQPEVLPLGPPSDLITDGQWKRVNGFPGDEILLGDDFDVLIQAHPPRDGSEVAPIAEYQDSQGESFFGDLYTEASGCVVIGDTSYLMYWYDSPKSINTISEELGLTPGKDVFEYVHDHERIGGEPDDFKVPLNDMTADFLSKGQIPLAVTDPGLFKHDRRSSDHVDAARMQPASTVKQIMHLADSAKNKYQRRAIAEGFDKYTADFGEILMFAMASKGLDEHQDKVQVINRLVDDLPLCTHGATNLVRSFTLFEKHGPGKRDRQIDGYYRWLGDVMLPHLIDLNDRIRKLEARRAQEVAA